jgi:hypothetical protein
VEGKEQVEQWAEVRLSPAGDGAEDAEETCEKQKRSTWWMDVLVGGSGQGLFTWETRSSRSVTSSCRQGRVQKERVRGACRHLQNTAKRLHRALGDAPARRQRRPANRPVGAVYRHAMAPACRPVLAEQSWRGTRDSAPPPAAQMGLALANDVRTFKGSIAH